MARNKGNKVIEVYLGELVDENVSCDQTLSLRNYFTIIDEHKGIPFAYRTSGKFIFYRVLNPIQYKHIQTLIGIRDRINEKGTKENTKYYMKSKEMNIRIQSWYRKVHNQVFEGEYKEIAHS